MPAAVKRVTVKRVYEKPARGDGYRVLVDRLWPRGLSKSQAALHSWLRDLSPSDQLRRWFHGHLRLADIPQTVSQGTGVASGREGAR
jgi:uncharacterized protein YeaO (DUF488 family)